MRTILAGVLLSAVTTAAGQLDVDGEPRVLGPAVEVGAGERG